jgi:hypothetical protein
MEIVQASEYQIGHRCGLVGNDTGSLLWSLYLRMACMVDPQCGLSQRDLNMHNLGFGKVAVEGLNRVQRRHSA